MDKVFAPFSPSQVDALNAYQAQEYTHPFTCKCGTVLVAQPYGWECVNCPDYRQDWAWSPMAITTGRNKS
jgi:hypothetical protein